MEGDNEHIDPTELEEGLLQDVQAAARRYKEAAAALEAAQDELKAAGENLKATAEAGDQADGEDAQGAQRTHEQGVAVGQHRGEIPLVHVSAPSIRRSPPGGVRADAPRH